MGKAFATASNSGELSKKLYDFNKAAIATIKGYDGQPIFIGGDDLFFFAPIFNPGKGSIFTLLDSLEGDFRKALDNDCPASLSFGVSITYYKYPMSEAVRLAQELLDDAKGRYVQSDTIKKNNILFSVQKHSGHTRGALIHKGCAKTVSLFNQFADKYSISKSEDDKDEANNGIFLRSVMHNLREHEPIILNAINDSNRLQNYFDNNYNEPVHDSYKGFFKDLKCLMLTAYYEYGQKIEGLKPLMPPTADGMGRPEGYDAAYAAIDLVYALLQFIHLVNSQRDV
jgi:CRISPR-associated protein Cmr2